MNLLYGNQMKELSDYTKVLFNNWLISSQMTLEQVLEYRKCDGFDIVTAYIDDKNIQEIYIVCIQDGQLTQIGAAMTPDPKSSQYNFLMECSMVMHRLAALLDNENIQKNDNGSWGPKHFSNIISKWYTHTKAII